MAASSGAQSGGCNGSVAGASGRRKCVTGWLVPATVRKRARTGRKCTASLAAGVPTFGVLRRRAVAERRRVARRQMDGSARRSSRGAHGTSGLPGASPGHGCQGSDCHRGAAGGCGGFGMVGRRSRTFDADAMVVAGPGSREPDSCFFHAFWSREGAVPAGR